MRPEAESVATAGVLLWVGTMLGLACGPAVFACTQHSDCRSGTVTGSCEASGWCSFPDASCPSGSRYGGLAGDQLADRCVTPDGASTGADEAGSTGATGTTASTITASSASSPSSSDPTAAESSASAGSGDSGTASCGDGEVQADEPCDDGNEIAGDGCNPGCVAAGEPQWNVIVDGGAGGFDGAFTIEAFTDGDLAVGIARSDGMRALPGVWRLDPEGGTVWEWSFGDAIVWEEAYTWGLDVAAPGNDQEVIAVSAAGFGMQVDQNAVAMLDGGGNPRWSTVDTATGFAVAIDPFGELWAGGYDAQHAGVMFHYGADGMLIETVVGEPFAPDTGFPFELAFDGGVRLLATGIYDDAEGNSPAYLRSLGDMAPQIDVTLGPHNEGLGLAHDPNAGLDWVVGYTETSGAEDGHGWIAAYASGQVALAPTIVTEDAQANLHGVAIDPSGAAVAVGWETPAGDRDPVVIKVAPDGTVVWSRSYPGAGDGELRDVVVASDGSIFVTGQVTGADGSEDGWIARLAP
jgi:cysteine-rich repeat protein